MNERTNQPTNEPTNQRTNQPTNERTNQPTSQTTKERTNERTNQPTNQPPNERTNERTNQSTKPTKPTPWIGVLLEKSCAYRNEIFRLVLRHINPLHPSTSTYISILFCHLRPDLPRSIFLLHFVTKTLLTRLKRHG